MTEVDVYNALSDPKVRAAMVAEYRHRMAYEVGPLARKVLKEILEMEAQTLQERRLQLDAAKTVYDRIGVIPPKEAPDAASGQRKPEDYSVDELESLVSQMKAKAAANAKPVLDNVPNGTQSDPQLIDMLK